MSKTSLCIFCSINPVLVKDTRRVTIISVPQAPIIVPHAQQKTDQRYPYEMLFRSVQYALVDNACREFLFISEFFMLDTNTAQELFNNIFSKYIISCISMTICCQARHCLCWSSRLIAPYRTVLTAYRSSSAYTWCRGTSCCATSGVWGGWTGTWGG